MTTETKTSPVGREAVQERGGFKARVVRSTVVNVTVSVLLKAAVLAQSIILARTFAPGDLGLLASALMTVSLVTLFGQLGSDQAIIRHRADADERPLLDTAFTLNLMVGVALFAVVFAGAPAIATLAGRPESADHLRLLGALVLGPAFTMPAALWTRHFRFGVAKIPQFADIAVFLGTTLGLERAGFGVASLFWGKLAGFAVNSATLWALAPYRPRLAVDRALARDFLAFGWPLLANSVCNYFVWQGDQWLVLYFWGAESLAFYALAFTLPFYLKELVDLASAALFPLFARVQGSRRALAEAFTESNRFLAILIVPGGVFLFVFAEPTIRLVYSEAWLPAVPLLKLIALATMLSVVLGYNWGSLATAAGRTRLLLYVNLSIIALLATVGRLMVERLGPVGGAAFALIQLAITTAAFRLPIIRREAGSLAFLGAIVRPLLAGAVTGTVAYVVLLPAMTSVARLVAAIAAFSVLYAAVLAVIDRRFVGDVRYALGAVLGR